MQNHGDQNRHIAHQERVRAHREAQNHRQQANPDANHGGPPTFQNLLRQYQQARDAVRRGYTDDQVNMDDLRANERFCRDELLRAYPDREEYVTPLYEPNERPPEQQIDPATTVIRVYILGTSCHQAAWNIFWQWIGNMVITFVMIFTFDAVMSSQNFSTLSEILETYIGGRIAFIHEALWQLGLFDILPYAPWFIGSCVLFYLWFFGKNRLLNSFSGIAPNFHGNTNLPTDMDNRFARMRVLPNTFYALKGYTHYFEVAIPKFFTQVRERDVHSVIAGCTTDSQLTHIAYSTLIRDPVLLSSFERYQRQQNYRCREYEYYCRYYSSYLAQQHMLHLHETALITGRTGKIQLSTFSGGELNFRFSGRIDGIIHTGIMRQAFEESQSTDQWIDNGKFVVVAFRIKQRYYKKKYSAGMTPIEWKNTHPFTEVDHVNRKRLMRYRTKIMTFHNGGVLYARTNNNLYSALNRMFTCREKSPELEFELQSNQRRNVRVGTRRYGKLISIVTSLVRQQFTQDCEIDDLVGQLQVITEAHPKKKLREEAFKYIQELTLIKNATYTQKVTAKVKIEVAKFMKNARVYVDMTTPQSLLGAWLVKPLKEAMEVVDLGWCLLRFAGHTDAATMHSCFSMLRDRSTIPICLYHSDDAVLQLPCQDGLFICNLDISSCDRSNGQAIFNMLLECVPDGPWRFIYERMIQGASLPLVIPNPSDPSEYLKVAPTEPFEYSGINITTVLNNQALIAIALSIFFKFRPSLTRAQVSQMIPKCAKSVGYIVTVQECECFEQIQFLKYSPSDPISCLPVRNLGCILRAIGHYDGDLPGSGPIEDRARVHVSQVVTGITTGYIDCVAHILRERFRSTTPIQAKYQWEIASFVETVPDTFLLKRYSLDAYEIEILKELVRRADIGDYVTSPVLDKIFRLDYG